MFVRSTALLFLGSLATLCSGCGGGGNGDGSSQDPTPSGTGHMTVLATDVPFVHDIVTDARITVDRVRIHTDSGADDGDSGFITLYDGPPREIELSALQNAVTAELASSDLPAGTYRQMRIHVIAAQLALVNGDTFSTAAGNLHLTSQGTSGFKVFISPPITITDGLARTLLLDFDLTKTFHPIPANDPLSANTYSLNPVIHVANMSTTGEIRGVVTKHVTGGGTVPVVGATVYILLSGETNLDDSVATTATVAGGAYAEMGLAPGVYDVHAAKDGLEGSVNGQIVVANSVTPVDVVID
jgi:hypothetical protein